jgi:hypothetical protein
MLAAIRSPHRATPSQQSDPRSTWLGVRFLILFLRRTRHEGLLARVGAVLRKVPITRLPHAGRAVDLADTCTQPKGKGKINSPRELLRPYLPRTRMRNRANREGWAMGKPTSNSGKEKELLGEGRPTPPIL